SAPRPFSADPTTAAQTAGPDVDRQPAAGGHLHFRGPVPQPAAHGRVDRLRGKLAKQPGRREPGPDRDRTPRPAPRQAARPGALSPAGAVLPAFTRPAAGGVGKPDRKSVV